MEEINSDFFQADLHYAGRSRTDVIAAVICLSDRAESQPTLLCDRTIGYGRFSAAGSKMVHFVAVEPKIANNKFAFRLPGRTEAALITPLPVSVINGQAGSNPKVRLTGDPVRTLRHSITN